MKRDSCIAGDVFIVVRVDQKKKEMGWARDQPCKCIPCAVVGR